MKHKMDQSAGGRTPKDPLTRQCRYCKLFIHKEACVCPECGRHQNRVWNHVRIDHIGIPIALAMVILSILQFLEARKDRIEAGDALKRARQAESLANNLKHLVKEANDSLAKTENVIQFSTLVTRAQNDDRGAFNQLLRTYHEKGPFQDIAIRVVEEIALDLTREVRVHPPVDWTRVGIDPNTATLDELKKHFTPIARAFQPDYLKNTWGQNRFTKAERLQFLYEVIKDTNSLHALKTACSLMNTEAKLDTNFLRPTAYMEWWNQNKLRFTPSEQAR